MQAHRHTISAHTSGLFNGDQLKYRMISGTDFKIEVQKYISYKKDGKIHQVHVITCFNRSICPRVKIMFQKCHSINKIITRDTCVTLQAKIIRGNEKRTGFANKNTKLTKIWIKRSIKQFLKSKSTCKNNIYRTVAFTQVLQNLCKVRGSVYILEQTLQTLGLGLLQIERISTRNGFSLL